MTYTTLLRVEMKRCIHMDTKPFLITIETNKSGEINTLLNKKIQEYQDGGSRSVCIDLSRLSALYSMVIGQITWIIKAAKSKGGDIYIFAPRSTIEETLKIVQFHHIAVIIKDREEFETVCNGGAIQKERGIKRTQEMKSQGDGVQKDVKASNSVSATVEKKPIKLGTVIAFSMLSIALLFFIMFSVFQYFTINLL